MSTSTATPPTDTALVVAVLKRVANDLGMILGQTLSLYDEEIERATARPAGPHQIHISFKFALQAEGGPEQHGCLLVPLPDAIGMACFLLMIPEETVAARRAETTLDPTLKDAMLELGNMIGGAVSMAMNDLELMRWSARSKGCQGVRADVRPAFPFPPGSELVVGRARTQLGPFPPFELILMLPPVG